MLYPFVKFALTFILLTLAHRAYIRVLDDHDKMPRHEFITTIVVALIYFLIAGALLEAGIHDIVFSAKG